jgi:hypothetical protein
MIHHISLAAKDPKHVADVFAELMGGKAYPFPGGFRDSYMAVSGDRHGTAIEVYPLGLRLSPEGEGASPTEGRADAGYVPFHLLLSVPVDQATIEQIGTREGWLTRLCGRGAPGQKPVFHVIEFWVENTILVELAPMDMIGEYEQIVQLDKMDAFEAMARQAAPV